MASSMTTWYVIAGETRAKMIAGDSDGFVLVEELISARAAAATGRAEQDFAHLVADVVNKAANEESFTKLVLVAGPETSSAIKAALNQQNMAHLAGEDHHDLVQLPMAELRARLAQIPVGP